MAALLVVLFHTAAYLEFNGHALGPVFVLGRDTGFAGVDIFFVISGFIMAWTTHGTGGAGDALLFMKRRFARVYSGYWIFLLLAAGLIFALEPGRLEGKDYLGSILLWPTDIGRLLIPVSWTLIFEMFFYVLFGVMIALAGERRAAWTRGIFVVALAWFLYSQFVRQAYSADNIGQISLYENYWAFPFLLQFLTGALLADWLRTHREGAAWSLLLAGVVLWGLAGWLNQSVFAGTLTQGHMIMWRVFLFGLPSLLLVAGAVRLEFAGRRGPLGIAVLSGGASYALYLSHNLILFLADHLGFHAALRGESAWLVQGAYILLVGIIALYSMGHYQWVERPAHRVFRRLLRAEAVG